MKSEPNFLLYGAIIFAVLGGLFGLVTALPLLEIRPFEVAGRVVGFVAIAGGFGAMGGALISFLRKN